MIMSGLNQSIIRYNLKLWIYVLSIVMMILPHSLVFGNTVNTIISALIYILIPIYWVVYFCKFNHKYLDNLIDLSIPAIYIVSILGILQYFFSPDLFGLLEKNSNQLEWASKTTFEVYKHYFRATSTLGSPQVYGLLIAFYIVLIHFRTENKNKYTWLGLLILLFSGLLSANKSFIAVLIGYFILTTLLSSKVKHLVLRMVLAFLLLIVLNYGANIVHDYMPISERFSTYEKLTGSYQYNKMWDIYSTIFSEANPIFGNGLGSLRQGNISSITAAESYFLKIYYELGFIVLAFFFIFLMNSYYIAYRSNFYGLPILILLIILSMFLVHAFESPAFFMFWGLLICKYPINQTNSPQQYGLIHSN